MILRQKLCCIIYWSIIFTIDWWTVYKRIFSTTRESWSTRDKKKKKKEKGGKVKNQTSSLREGTIYTLLCYALLCTSISYTKDLRQRIFSLFLFCQLSVCNAGLEEETMKVDSNKKKKKRNR